MKMYSFAIITAAVCVFTLLSGCKSNSVTSSAPKDPAKAAALVNDANQILIPHIALIGTYPLDTAAFDLSSANSLYNEALTDDPDNLDAHFGAALTEVLTLFSDPTIASLQKSGEVSFSAKPMLTIMKSGGVQEFTSPISSSVLNRIRSVMKPSLTAHALLAKSQAGQLPSYYQNVAETKILPVLADAILQLKQVTQNSSYQFLITPQMMGVDNGPTYRIDLTEIYLLLALFQFFDADASLFVAYNIDYNAASAASVTQAWQPSSPFLALRSNGAQRMKDTRAYYLGMASSITSGLTFLMNEPSHTQTDLIVYNPQDQSEFLSAIQSMDTLTALFSGPRAEGGVTFNLVNLFDNPMTDLKTKIPPYTASSRPNSSGTYDAVLTWQASSFDNWIFPDPTLNGFLPGMTDAELKQLFGINAATWMPSIVISG
ncbi:MAG TPA: hypothetical protein VMF88_00420 [Bacteroidota bacterium]|nr:hypothetical protein [Bacteroidota bacterium]